MATPAETFLDHWFEDYPNWRESESARDMVRKVEQALERIGTGGHRTHLPSLSAPQPTSATEQRSGTRQMVSARC